MGLRASSQDAQTPIMKYLLVCKPPGGVAHEVTVETADVLPHLQTLVHGLVETVPIGTGVDLLANENGIALNLPANCGYLGTIVFIGVDEAEGRWKSLDADQARKAKKWCELHKDDVPNRNGALTIVSGKEEFMRMLDE